MKRPMFFELEETRNVILRGMEPLAAERLAPHLRPIELALGMELARRGAVPDTVHFPEAGMLSNILDSDQNVGVEVNVVGREGACDTIRALNETPRLERCVVQAAGWGWALPSEVLREEFARGCGLQRSLVRYFDLLHTQTALTAMCNRLHTVEERLSRWLLIVRNGAESDTFDLTPKFLACMLGTRMSGVPVALGVLARAGLIEVDGSPSNIHTTLLDVPGIERSSCECHALFTRRLELYLDARAAEPARSR